MLSNYTNAAEGRKKPWLNAAIGNMIPVDPITQTEVPTN